MPKQLLETIKQQLHTFAMTDDERADIRLRLASHMHTYHSTRRVPSPYMFGVWQKRLSVIAAVFLIVMITGGSGLAYASNDALPGDVLYSVKVNAVEEVQAAIKPTAQARAEFEVKRVEKRIGEAVTLAAKGQLDTKKKEAITSNLERHTKKVAEETTKLIEESPDSAVEVSAKLALSLQAHTEAITTAQEQNKVDGELDDIIEQVAAVQEHAEVEKATATEALVSNGETAISLNDINDKKDRLNKSFNELFTPIEAPLEVLGSDSTTDTPFAVETTAKIVTPAPSTETQTPSEKDQIATLFTEADAFIAAGNYTDAFLSLQKAEELMLKIQITQEVAENLNALETAPVMPEAPAAEQPVEQKPAPVQTTPVESTTVQENTTVNTSSGNTPTNNQQNNNDQSVDVDINIKI